MKYLNSTVALDEEQINLELSKINEALSNPEFSHLQLDVLTSLPPKPVEGMLIYAKPPAVATAGVYVFTGSSWVNL